MSDVQATWSSLLVLLLVLASIPLALWALRRQRAFGPRGAQIFSVEGGLLLGTRERIALVRADTRWLVVGITPQSITLLTELDGPPAGLAGPGTGAGTGTGTGIDATSPTAGKAHPVQADGSPGAAAAGLTTGTPSRGAGPFQDLLRRMGGGHDAR